MKTLSTVEAFFIKYKQHGPSVAFALGFLWDSLTLTRVDMLYDNLVLTFYLTAATTGIVLFHTHAARKLRSRLIENLAPWLPFIIQFAFGGLFSGYIIYYSRSGTLVGSWPFLLFLLALFIGNEIFKKRYQLLTFQFSVLFIAFFSYTIFSIPVLVRAIGTPLFLVSGLVSLLLTALVIALVYTITPERVREARVPLTYSLIGLYVFFNLAYFTNIIPPIPLALKDLAVAHYVERTSEGYRIRYESPPWYRFFDETSRTYHLQTGEGIYAFSAVFAPTRLNTTILHRWSFYDRTKEQWIVASEIPFAITGGRDGGYRGYSTKSVLFPGKWRIEVVTKSGQLIGRRTFTVVRADAIPELHEAIK